MLLSVPEILCWLIWFFWQSFSSLWVIKFIDLFKISWGHLSKYFRNTIWIWYNFKSCWEAKWKRTRNWCENNTGHFESFYCKHIHILIYIEILSSGSHHFHCAMLQENNTEKSKEENQGFSIKTKFFAKPEQLNVGTNNENIEIVGQYLVFK